MIDLDEIPIINAPVSPLGVDHKQMFVDALSAHQLTALCDRYHPVYDAVNDHPAWGKARGRNAIKEVLRKLPQRSDQPGVLTLDHVRLSLTDLRDFLSVATTLAPHYLDLVGELWITEVIGCRDHLNRIFLHVHSLREMDKNIRDAAIRSPYLGDGDAIVGLQHPFHGRGTYGDLDDIEKTLTRLSFGVSKTSEEGMSLADDVGGRLWESRVTFASQLRTGE